MSSILDVKNNLLFIHIPKTAGSAITKLICPDPPEFDGQKYPDQEFIRLGRFHWSANKILSTYPQHFLEATTFAVTRNPFSWLQSIYYYQIHNPNAPYHDIGVEQDFSHFIKYFTEHDGRTITKYLCSENKIIIKHVFKFENFQEQVIPFLKKHYSFDQLLKENISKPKKLKLEQEFSLNLFNYVYERYESDINNFGYHDFAKDLENKIKLSN